MTSILDRLPHGARAGIVRLRSLGDCVLSTPAIRLLKQHRPDLSLAVVVEPRFAPVFEHNPDIDAILPPGARALRRFAPALCLNLHGGVTSARITALSGARHRAGFHHFRFRHLYNVPIPSAQRILNTGRKVHTAEHAASAMFHLGVPQTEIPRARLFSIPADRTRNFTGPYAVIHPVASEPAKTWPPAFFLEAAQHIKRSLDLEPVFIAGPGEDLSPFQKWPTVTNIPLAQIKPLLQNATLFLGNDSGPAHMAAAFQLPTIVLFGPSDPVVWAPWRTSSEVLVSQGPIHNITPQQVIVALGKMRVHA